MIVAPNHEIAFEGARMFGQFINELSDLDPNNIVDTIPRFHDINFRMENFEIAVKEDPFKQSKSIEVLRLST
jgi:hypothetical protein